MAEQPLQVGAGLVELVVANVMEGVDEMSGHLLGNPDLDRVGNELLIRDRLIGDGPA